MLTRYAKLVYKFHFTSTVDFVIYFSTSNECMRLNYTYFITKITRLNRD